MISSGSMPGYQHGRGSIKDSDEQRNNKQCDRGPLHISPSAPKPLSFGPNQGRWRQPCSRQLLHNRPGGEEATCDSNEPCIDEHSKSILINSLEEVRLLQQSLAVPSTFEAR